MNQKDPKIELRQEELREILGIVPPWIVRWGTVLIAIVLLILLIGAAWFRYPDRISSQVVLTTSIPPVLLPAGKDARIHLLFAEDDGPVSGRLLLSIKDAAKVKIGNRVVLRIDDYPYMQFGIVKGTVERISLDTKQNHYAVDIALPGGLKTTYKKELTYSQNMTGQALILTDSKSLLTRILDPVKSLISRKYN